MEHTVPVLLHHLGVDVEAGVPQLGDLFGQELYSLGGVAEDDRLVDLELEPKTNTNIKGRCKHGTGLSHWVSGVAGLGRKQLDESILRDTIIEKIQLAFIASVVVYDCDL